MEELRRWDVTVAETLLDPLMSETTRHPRKVSPGVVIAQPNDVISFNNQTNNTLYVQILGLGSQFTIGPNQRCDMPIPATANGIHPYAVFCYEEQVFATGSSMPIIIVPVAAI